MATVTLPKIPKEAEFEELVAALLQSTGYYVERRIEEHEQGVQVLELDVITSDYLQSPPDIRIHEVKSGKWGLKEVFKVGGWMRHLKIEHGSFIVQDSLTDEELQKIRDIATNLGIEFVCITDMTKPEEILDQLTTRPRYDPGDVAVWRFSYWLERRLMARLAAQRKSGPERFRVLFDHARAITHGVFFQPTIVDRLDALYDVYREYPHLSAVVASEMAGGALDPEATGIPQKIFNQTFYERKDNAVKTVAFLEHQARLGVMKAAIDYILYKRAGQTTKADRTWRMKFGENAVEFSHYNMLPQSFRDGLEKIQKEPYVHLYPLFWQWFMWAFGGFILTDLKDREYAALAERTSIPIDHIPAALAAYDALFCVADGWFVDGYRSNMRLLRILPVPFRGIGSFLRRIVHTKSMDLADLHLGGQFTTSDMEKWISVLVKYLS